MIKRILRLLGREPSPTDAPSEQATVAVPADEFPIPEEWQPLLDEMERSRGHLFITGQPGTGKSTLMGLFRRLTGKNVVVLAPTGLAAITAGGVTIHSFAQLPSTVITQESVRDAADRELVCAIDTIIIDEISQVRCDMLDGLDCFMRRNARDATLPFGGVQVILVGDPYQLPPVVTDEERQLLERVGYPGPFYFWNANVYPELTPRRVELKTVYHRAEEGVLDILGCLRANDMDNAKLDLLQQCVADPEFDPSASPLHTRLTANNSEAAYYNNRELYRLPAPQQEYRAKHSGAALNINSPDCNFPCEENLVLRRGARVICCRTVSQMLEYGTVGTVVDLEEGAVMVRTDDNRSVRLVPSVWELFRYSYNRETGKVEPTVTGTIEQIPLRHAWALTIHRSQGIRLDRTHIDLANETFPRGQAYIALSRCRTLAGTKLKTKFFSLDPRDMLVDEDVVGFMMQTPS